MTLLQTLTTDALAHSTEVISHLSFDFYLRLAINILSVFTLIRLIYVPVYKNRDLFFTYFIFNLIIFFICYVMNKVELSMGAAFGLFAVFSMLRYRTEDISIRDMTYLFLAIALGLINSVTKGPWETLAILNAIVLGFTMLLETPILRKREAYHNIMYEHIELITPEKRTELIEDLQKRTGLKIHKVSVQKIDFLRDSVNLRIYYYE